MRRVALWLLMLGAAAAAAQPTSPPVPSVSSQQRWLLTPAQRAAIEQARRAALAAAPDAQAEDNGPWRLDGLAQPRQAGGSAWINGQLVQAGDRLAPSVRLRAIRPDGVILEREGRRIALRPGQTLEPDGQARDLLPPTPSPAPALVSMRLTPSTAADEPR
ncbi:MAG: general secretion pathway protein GspB [Thiobacillaceae bacterium]